MHNQKKQKNKKKGKSETTDRRNIPLKEEGQIYAQAIKMLGAGRIMLQCFDNKQRIGHIRGTMKKRCWINVGDIVLACLRDFQDGIVDIVAKYTADEARFLKAGGHIPETTVQEIIKNEDDILFEEDHSVKEELKEGFKESEIDDI